MLTFVDKVNCYRTLYLSFLFLMDNVIAMFDIVYQMNDHKSG